MSDFEARYWEEKYKAGTVSCRGSRGRLKRWNFKMIERWVGSPLEEVPIIDVGCGDARLWRGRKKPMFYTGIDPSMTALEDAKKMIPRGTFIHSGAEIPRPIEAPVVMCIALIYHLMSRDLVEDILENLCRWSSRLIFIYSWTVDPSPYDETYQKYWDLSHFKGIFEGAGFKLRATVLNDIDPVGGMYVYRKNESLEEKAK